MQAKTRHLLLRVAAAGCARIPRNPWRKVPCSEPDRQIARLGWSPIAGCARTGLSLTSVPHHCGLSYSRADPPAQFPATSRFGGSLHANELIVTFVGDDAPGLVEQIAAAVSSGGGNWLESRSTQLGGRFAGILRIGSGSASRLEGSLRALADNSLHISVEDGAAASHAERVTLYLLGLDRPGIVHKVTRALSSLGINVVNLRTSVSAAAMSGEIMFEATALVDCGPDCADRGRSRRCIPDADHRC